jgi:hypothetical protein
MRPKLDRGNFLELKLLAQVSITFDAAFRHADYTDVTNPATGMAAGSTFLIVLPMIHSSFLQQV